MNLMGFDYTSVGNHEFDEGTQELLRMQYGNEPGFRYTPGPSPTDAIPSMAAATAIRTSAPTSHTSPPTSPTETPAKRSSRRTPSITSKAASRSRSSA